jgi:Co/Zn/Cd efflux system component
MLPLLHRTGDANVRAVWLFSRNDAMGNLAVVTAAGFVWLSATRWPDLVVAAVIAVLFLHSAFEILRDSLRELRAGKPVSASPQSK